MPFAAVQNFRKNSRQLDVHGEERSFAASARLTATTERSGHTKASELHFRLHSATSVYPRIGSALLHGLLAFSGSA